MFSFFILGSTAGFCNGKNDGMFQSPYSKHRFFSCANGMATPCQSCAGDLVFVEKCQECMVHDAGKNFQKL